MGKIPDALAPVLPEDGGRTNTEEAAVMELGETPQVVDPKKGRALWHLGALLVFKALGEETHGRFWALEGLADRHMAVPLHAHGREDEIWYVLDGQIIFTVGDRTFEAGAGTFAYIPRTVPHTFQVVSDTARWFGIGVPAGLDQWFFETGEPAETLTLPPPLAGPPDVDSLIASLRAYGTETLGPPPNAQPSR